MLEAKGLGYEWAIRPDGDWRPGYEGAEKMRNEMDRQVVAAQGRTIEWHFADPRVAAVMGGYAAQQGYANIVIIVTPYIQR